MQTKKERRRCTEEERNEIIENYRRSGRTQKVFAREAGIGLSTLSYWLRRNGGGARSNGPDWIEVSPRPLNGGGFAPDPAVYRVRFPSGLVVELAPGFVAEEAGRLCRVIREL